MGALHQGCQITLTAGAGSWRPRMATTRIQIQFRFALFQIAAVTTYCSGSCAGLHNGRAVATFVGCEREVR